MPPFRPPEQSWACADTEKSVAATNGMRSFAFMSEPPFKLAANLRRAPSAQRAHRDFNDPPVIATCRAEYSASTVSMANIHALSCPSLTLNPPAVPGRLSKGESCPPTPSDFTACSVRRRSESIGRSSTPTQWSNGCRRTASPARSTIWMRKSAVPTRCRSRTSLRAIATLSAASISNWCPTNASATPTSSTTRTCPARCRTTVSLKKVSCGTELNIVQEGIPSVIPAEACYLGWQESLTLLAQLVEAEIPG